MDNKNEFKKFIKIGSIGETIFLEEFLKPFARSIRNKYNNVHIKDNRSNKKTDYTLIVNSNPIDFEIKSNYKDNNRIVLETISVENVDRNKSQNDKLGWIYTTTSDIIVFLSSSTHNMIFFDVKDLKKQFINIEKKYRNFRNKYPTKYGNLLWYGYFKIIPLNEFKNFIIYQNNIQNNVFNWIESNYINYKVLNLM